MSRQYPDWQIKTWRHRHTDRYWDHGKKIVVVAVVVINTLFKKKQKLLTKLKCSCLGW